MCNRIGLLVGMVLGLSLMAPGVLGADIRIAGLFNRTGAMSSIDAPGLKGARLQAKLISQAGGVLGGQGIELVPYDTRTNSEAAATAAATALSAGVVAGVGYGDSSFVLATAPLFQDRGVPFVTSGATHPLLPQRVGAYLFLTAFGDDDQAAAMAEFTVRRLQANNLAIWTDQSTDFTRALSGFFKHRIQALGARVVLEDVFQTGDGDFSAQIARLKTLAPQADGIFVAAVPSDARTTVKQIRAAGLALPILSGDGFDTELLTQVPGQPLATEVYFATHTYREDRRPEVLAFVAAYEKEYGHAPENAFAALGFDAVGLVIDALRRAGTTEGKALRDALAATRGYQGVTGQISYSRPTRVPVKGVSIISVKAGRYRVEETWLPEAN